MLALGGSIHYACLQGTAARVHVTGTHVHVTAAHVHVTGARAHVCAHA